MSRIEINAGGRHVIVDHDGELEPLRAAALALWRDTESAQPSPGPAVGFVQERRWSAQVAPLGNGAYNNGQPPAPINADIGLGGDGHREGP